MWCIPPKANAAFVCQMEDVLEVYKLPYDPKRPLICMDEMPKQLLADKQEPLPAQVGTPARQDYEYKRNGVADLFMVFEPLAGKRFVEITEKRRKVEWATVMKKVADEVYPHVEKILVVLDKVVVCAVGRAAPILVTRVIVVELVNDVLPSVI